MPPPLLLALVRRSLLLSPKVRTTTGPGHFTHQQHGHIGNCLPPMRCLRSKISKVPPEQAAPPDPSSSSALIRPAVLIRPLLFACGIYSWWHEKLTSGQRVFYSILAINTLVFVSWRIPVLRDTMYKYFTCRPLVGAPLCLPMVLSTFSHTSLLHLGVNMYCFYTFSRSLGEVMGPEQLTALYLSSGVTASLASHCYKVAIGSTTASLGASGAILGVVAFTCSAYPNSQLLLIAIPMSAGTAIKAIMALDTTGCLLKWSFLDHAAHLGGAIFGMLYFHEGRSIYTKWSDKVTRLWKHVTENG